MYSVHVCMWCVFIVLLIASCSKDEGSKPRYSSREEAKQAFRELLKEKVRILIFMCRLMVYMHVTRCSYM